ncbi:MAG: hypothetical protein JWN44_5270 [Myxococcales bacterium]|nr:hypothetical protein [Myxococcales bacterium]
MRLVTAVVTATWMLGVAGAAEARPWLSFSPEQTAVTAGGGIASFAGATMRANTRLGADWDARVTFGTRSPIAFEAGYTGLYNPLATGSGVAPYLVQNSVDGALRINLIPYRVEPYIFGGLGYNHVTVYNRDQDPEMAARFKATDDQLMVPVGGGVAGYFGSHATIDARFTFRAMFRDELLIDAPPDVRSDSYTVAARAGYAF